MNNAPIGVFDSGVGGLTILREIQRRLPNESVVYLGDTANVPYGGRDVADILNLSRQLMLRMREAGVKLVVIACNTISVNCINELRAEFPDTPIVGAVPAVKAAADTSKTRRFGVLSTVATADSAYQAMLIERFAADCHVLNMGTNELVPRIENAARTHELPSVLTGVLQPFQAAEIDTLVLGCSHYPLVSNEISDILGPNVTLIDSGAAIARQVERVLQEHGLLNESGETPYYRYETTAPSSALECVLASLGMCQPVAV